MVAGCSRLRQICRAAPSTCGPSSRGNHRTNDPQVWFAVLGLSTTGDFASRNVDGRRGHVYFLIVPVTPSREQLKGSIFRADGAYSFVERGNGCVKNSGSAKSTSRTSRWRAASKRSRSTDVSAAECSRPLVGCPACSTYWFSTP